MESIWLHCCHAVALASTFGFSGAGFFTALAALQSEGAHFFKVLATSYNDEVRNQTDCDSGICHGPAVLSRF